MRVQYGLHCDVTGSNKLIDIEPDEFSSSWNAYWPLSKDEFENILAWVYNRGKWYAMMEHERSERGKVA